MNLLDKLIAKTVELALSEGLIEVKNNTRLYTQMQDLNVYLLEKN